MLGGFDPGYFLYQEDTDFCFRARQAGYCIGYADDTLVHHLHRQSQRELSEYEYRRRIFEGSALFWEKHYAPRDVMRMVRFQYWVTRILLRLGRIRWWLPVPAVLSETRLQARNDVCGSWLEKRGCRRMGLSGIPGKNLSPAMSYRRGMDPAGKISAGRLLVGQRAIAFKARAHST